MARDPSLLSSIAPSAIARARVHIGHVQLRDLLICPRNPGVVNYIQNQSIIEHNLHSPNSHPYAIAELSFTPNTLTSLPIGQNDTLIAAGGQEAEIHLSYHGSPSSRRRGNNLVWQFERQLSGSINNSVLLTSLNLARSNESSVEPRIGISNNDCTVKFYDIPLRGQNQKRTIKEAGSLRLDVPINHSSISPDGRTLLSVGDSNQVFFHRIFGGGRLSFSPISTLTLPPPDVSPLIYHSSSLAASFSTAFSSDGCKFAVASQEGVVAVWDVRSSKPLKVFQTDKTRLPMGAGGTPAWLSDDPWEWSRGSSKAPGWSVRNVKFSSGGSNGTGKEILTFTEHTSYLHIVDARTFEIDEVVRVPSISKKPSETTPSPPSSSQPQTQSQPQLRSHPPPPPWTRHPLASTSNVFGTSPSWPPNRLGSASPQPQFLVPTNWDTPLPIVQALGDAFRIPPRAYSPPASISDSTWRTLRRAMGDGSTVSSARLLADDRINWERERRNERTADPRERGSDPREDYDDILVIPPLGDRDVESEVHALLEIHGIPARRRGDENSGPEADRDRDQEEEQANDVEADTNTGSTHADFEYRPGGSGLNSRRATSVTPPFVGRTQSRGDEEMEVDELESDCFSSFTPSRSSSPSPSTTLARAAGGSTRAGSTATGLPSGYGPAGSTGWKGEVGYEDDLDLAGVCFDPSGGYVYVASTQSVVEWSVRGAEKRWSFEKGWK